MSIRTGLWGARMDNSGLGIQTWEFYHNMKPDKTLVVDISVLERNPERILKQYPERYQSKAVFIAGIPNENDIREFLQGLDVVFIAESAYNMVFYQIAKEMGVKTAVQYNYEFFDWGEGSIWATCPPDLFIAPSTWHYDDVSKAAEKRGSKHVYLHCPVNRAEIKRRHIDTASTFVHVAGRPAHLDRNGTTTFLEAIKLSEGGLQGIVLTQDSGLENQIRKEYPMVDVRHGTENYADNYKKGSVLVLPRKYGGNCLPMNEALAAGMPVIMSKISPQIDLLPERWLITSHKREEIWNPRPGVNIEVFDVDVAELMFRMLWFQSLSQVDMKEQSTRASMLAQTISWEVMEPQYREVLEALAVL